MFVQICPRAPGLLGFDVEQNLAKETAGHEATITARVCQEDGKDHTTGSMVHQDIYPGCQFTPIVKTGVQTVEELRYSGQYLELAQSCDLANTVATRCWYPI